MLDQIARLFSTPLWWSYVLRIVLFYALAWLIHRLAGPMAGRIVLLSHVAPETDRARPERSATLQSLIASALSFAAFAIATLVSVGQFVPLNTLVWIIGLFSAAFGLGARPLISDFLTGVSFIFEDTFAEGEKVEILGVEGVVEVVSLRTTMVRGSTGELYIVPNGEVRVVRNFSRGRFSIADIKLKIVASDLGRALSLLEELGREAVALLPNLLEPWQVISESGVIGHQTELRLVAKARFGMAAEMRPRLLTLVQERLSDAGITLAD